MNIIPVIDLSQGQVVRAVRGDRKSYRPIQSLLCGGSSPVVVAQALRRHCATSQLYVADLDALQGGLSQIATLRALLEADHTLELWLDGGFADTPAAEHVLGALAGHRGRVTPVFGSESLRSTAAFAAAFDAPSGTRPNAVLSLDRRDGQRLDSAHCWDTPARWPQRVIVMTLERVGAAAGPDLDTLADVKRKAPWATLIGAGGIRNLADLERAEAAGASAWLVASALHDGSLPPVLPSRA